MNTSEAREVLGVDGAATLPQLKSAYRDLLKTWHPDRCASGSAGYEDAVQQTQRINRAYRVLTEAPGGWGSPVNEYATSVESDWGGRSIRTIDSQWQPVRWMTEGTNARDGAKMFLSLWIVMVAVGLLAEWAGSFL